MEDKRCFIPGCTHDVEYSCPCAFPNVYTCKEHALNHLEFTNKDHALKSLFVEPCKGTKETILKFIEKVGSKHKKVKKKVLTSFSQRSIEAESDLRELMNKIDSYLDELNNLFEKVHQANRILKSEQDPVLALLSLQPEEAVERVKNMLPSNSDWCNDTKVFCWLSEKVEKMIDCFIQDKFEGLLDKRLNKLENALKEHDKSISLANNELANVKDSISNLMSENQKSLKEFEDWKRTINQKTEDEVNLFSAQINSIAEDLIKLKQVVENQCHADILTMQSLRDRKTEAGDKKNKVDSEKESDMAHPTFEENSSVQHSPLVQAYIGNSMTHQQQISLYNIIEKNDRTTLLIYNTETETKQEKIIHTPEVLDSWSCITQLPNGKLFCYGKYPRSGIALIIDEKGEVEVLPSGTPCKTSSATYFNNSVYCFGGDNNGALALSNRFDLGRNEWIELAPLPKADCCCNSIIFNWNILISGKCNINLVRYSIGSNSFTTIPYQFVAEKRKILINGERLYLIECGGSMYESEIGSDTTWRWISKSTINFDPCQPYFSYNKGGIYIGCYWHGMNYFKFSLDNKSLTKLH